ncbi:iron-sulfur cluster assembly scaffold protein [Metamycoplasma alkalescens]|uniref:Aminotransferase U-like protein n=1 Tax=Metamycoplasma alkalescens TaxID=45363 RepID=A0A318U5U4_9BACT|nr:iron-sulfur cluster assembly scaffold protein [Metamycoplasma alkalescens]PYF43705.1 nitrogen fixation NifU-like protein [Metamycoplasma alkalescens]SYV90656.1 Aminotransferase U-like protein [Metamycoplasma alkalescens]
MKFYNNQEKQKIIFDCYSTPKYKLNTKKNQGISEHSSVCVDEIELYLSFKNDLLVNAEYYAIGCAIFIASIELMIENLLNKTKKEINEILDQYFQMINEGNTQNKNFDLGKLSVFENVKIHLNRLECASIIYRAFKKGINE